MKGCMFNQMKPIFATYFLNILQGQASGFHTLTCLLNSWKDSVFKVGLSPSKKNFVICLIESPLKMMKNDFYFVLKAFFVLKI